jgi:hypothetical protein
MGAAISPPVNVCHRGPYLKQLDVLQRKIDLCNEYHKQKADYATKSRTKGIRLGGMGLFHKENEKDKREEADVIPLTTFRSFYNSGNWHASPDSMKLSGGQRYLSNTAESTLMAFLISMAALGLLFSPTEVKMLARDTYMATSLAAATDLAGLAGWFGGFMKRMTVGKPGYDHYYVNKRTEGGKSTKVIQILKVRPKPAGQSTMRGNSLSPKTVSSFAEDTVKPFLAAHPEMTLQDIGGFDEFMFDLNASLQHGKCVAPPGHLFTATPGERSEHVTVVAGHCGTWAAPMLIIFKGKNYNPDWERKVEKLFPELYRNGYIKITQTETGWVTNEAKLAYMKLIIDHPDLPNKTGEKLWM